MIFLIFITSGLFLGWSLGANDASNIFGTAVGSRMLTFKRAAWIASIFVILGAVIQGQGATDTLSSLGSVDALGGAFTVALCAGLTVFMMTRASLPVSTSQAVVGAIIGWSMFTGNPTDLNVLTKIIISWITGPVLGMIFSAILFVILRYSLRKFRIHALKLDSVLRNGLIIVGAFGAYSLGANNIANVMGVFVPSAPDIQMDFGIFVLNTAQVLFLVGGLAISVGIFTYSHKVMRTVGKGILSISPEGAMVIVMAQALVLFLFSSSSFSNFLVSVGLPPFPLVPVSSTQVVVGAVVGIGLVKGMQEVRLRTLGGIAAGWVITPIAGGIITFFALFFMQNVFDIKISSGVTQKINEVLTTAPESGPPVNLDMIFPGLFSLAIAAVIGLVFLFIRQNKLRQKAEMELAIQQNQVLESQKALNQLEIQTIQMENIILNTNLELKRKEMNTLLMNLSEQRSFYESIVKRLSSMKDMCENKELVRKIKDLRLLIKQKMSFSGELDEYYAELENVHKDFIIKLTTAYPNISPAEKRLATLVRLDFSNKEISAILNISPKSVEIARYRLRKKLNVRSGYNLTKFLTDL